MHNIVVIGTGDYYAKTLAPVLAQLQKEGFLNVVVTIDSVERRPCVALAEVDHRRREPGIPLRNLIADLKPLNPIVILAHANLYHATDAEDLVQHGFRVILQKPYAINQDELQILEHILDHYPQRLALVESYQTWNALLFLFLAGMVKSTVFNSPNSYGRLSASVSNDYWGQLRSLIGPPRYVQVNILEGSKMFGHLNHRGQHLIDLQQGGGMIQDLAIHALAPLMAVENLIGQIQNADCVRIARCQQYLKMVATRFNLPLKQVGETYAEMRFTTTTNVPVVVLVGKYVLGKDQRNITMVGEFGTMHCNLTNLSVTIILGEEIFSPLTFALQRLPLVHYTTIKEAINELLGQNQILEYSATAVNLRCQSLVLEVLRSTHQSVSTISVYSDGAQQIFV